MKHKQHRHTTYLAARSGDLAANSCPQILVGPSTGPHLRTSLAAGSDDLAAKICLLFCYVIWTLGGSRPRVETICPVARIPWQMVSNPARFQGPNWA